ncbi:MAG TPA: alcohol dehydrogenase catalytic domain-containing protein [Candidatus Brocadiia bacterium]|nr:alcohol dehydrogenase catalytic domain-containing protein [Candidatus Brocadiia bacterium]
MKAAVYEGIRNVVVKEVPTPKCGPREILLKVLGCAVCGTDVRIYHYGHATVTPPAITGHEIAGEIAEVGSEVSGYKVGQRCIVVTPVGCGVCKYCREARPNICATFKAIGYHFPGGFAQYCLINERAVAQGNIIIAPDGMDPDLMSIVEPFSCVINGQEYLDVQLGETVVVIGAGPIGSMHVELAKARGAGKVVLMDVSDSRLDLAKKQGLRADLIFNNMKEDPVKRIMAETDGLGAEVVIVACGVHAAMQQAVLMTAKRGRVSFFAGLPKDKPTLDIDANALHYREISVYGAFASCPRQYVQALQTIAAGAINAAGIVTARFPLDRMVAAYEAAQTGENLKVVVQPWA